MSFLVSLLLTAIMTPVVMIFARRMGWVARPREDRWHSKPTALMGGIVIYFCTITSWVLFVPGHVLHRGGAGSAGSSATGDRWSLFGIFDFQLQSRQDIHGGLREYVSWVLSRYSCAPGYSSKRAKPHSISAYAGCYFGGSNF